MIFKKQVVIVLGVIALLLPFMYLAFYCHGIGDDLTYSVLGQTKGIFTGGSLEYLRWNGRYFSNYLVCANPCGFGLPIVYQCIPVLLIASVILAVKHFLNTLFMNLATTQSWLWALVFTLLFIGSMPELGEGVYWYTGSVSYTLGSVLLLLSFSFSLRKKPLIAAVFLLLAMGCSELIMLLGVTAYTARYIALRKSLGLLLLAIALAAVVYFAPGNSNRLIHFPDNHNLLDSVVHSLLQTLRFSVTFLSVPLLVLSLVYVRYHKALCSRLTLLKQSFGMRLSWSVFLLLGLIFISVFPAYWSTGILGQHRTVNVAYFFWIFAWFINLNVLLNKYPRLLAIHEGLRISILIPIALALQVNVFFALQDILLKRHITHNSIMLTRAKLLNEHNSSDALYLPADTSGCETLHIYDLREDPEYFVNDAYQVFAGSGPVKVH